MTNKTINEMARFAAHQFGLVSEFLGDAMSLKDEKKRDALRKRALEIATESMHSFGTNDYFGKIIPCWVVWEYVRHVKNQRAYDKKKSLASIEDLDARRRDVHNDILSYVGERHGSQWDKAFEKFILQMSKEPEGGDE